MVATLFGVVLLICGWDVMKTAWFPILFLVCAIPWPQLVYSWVALPLQKLAATAAVVTLQLTGVDASQSGTKLTIGTGRVLNVAEACAGLKSLMTFVAVGAAIGFLSSRALWQKLLISLSAVPIAIFCNMMRVAGQGLLDHYVDRRLSESFAHQFVGMIMLIPAFFLIQGVAWVLDNLFIEEVDRHKVEAKARKAAATSPVVTTVAPRVGFPAPAEEDEVVAAARRLAAARLKQRRPADALAAPAGDSTREAK
jgi:exosortase